ncbi:hypothetical protein G4G27_15255 [Sphingomonas sp. So64.6b]|uniref:hypothetical protein n=1 Tax=Sphingomonas sp. So64.6b TaxID=2997354 RepID=UPI001601D987|nr:hypothetical protein [Sphingomonas sp. So64.6b]QNA85205.1 hypothetical protein G4G27_15255 [Sphingomonas sp. So64.6b]
MMIESIASTQEVITTNLARLPAMAFAPAPATCESLHPAWTAPPWTTTPAIAAMFALLRDLNALHDRAASLCHANPATGLDSVRGEIGAVTGLYENDFSGPMRLVWTVRANGGAAASLWELLGQHRDAWIDAQLAAEGFAPWTWNDAKHDRREALAEEAGTVAAAWAAFCGEDKCAGS